MRALKELLGRCFLMFSQVIGARIGCAILKAVYFDLGGPVLECMSFTCLLHSTWELLAVNGALAPSG